MCHIIVDYIAQFLKAECNQLFENPLFENPPEIARHFPKEIQQLVGYATHVSGDDGEVE